MRSLSISAIDRLRKSQIALRSTKRTTLGGLLRVLWIARLRKLRLAESIDSANRHIRQTARNKWRERRCVDFRVSDVITA